MNKGVIFLLMFIVFLIGAFAYINHENQVKEQQIVSLSNNNNKYSNYQLQHEQEIAGNIEPDETYVKLIKSKNLKNPSLSATTYKLVVIDLMDDKYSFEVTDKELYDYDINLDKDKGEWIKIPQSWIVDKI